MFPLRHPHDARKRLLYLIKRQRDNQQFTQLSPPVSKSYNMTAATEDADTIADEPIIVIDATAGTATTYGGILQTPDGSETKFNGTSTSYISGSTECYINGQKQVVGVDYTESDYGTCEITMTIAPATTDILILAYLQNAFTPDVKYATTGSSNPNLQVSGLINGSNKAFTTPGPYKEGTLRVYLNGGLQTQGTGEDWTETTSTTFTFITAPASPDVVSASYEAADGLRSYETTEDTLSYTFNGVNTTGTLSGPYEPGTLELDWSGQLLTPGADYVETNPGAGTFDTVSALAAGPLQSACTVGSQGAIVVGPRTSTTAATTSYEMTVYDKSVEADATSGAITITLPPVADVDGMDFNVIKMDSSVNGVTIEGTVNGVTDPVITIQYNSYTVRSDGTGYHLI